MKAVAPPVLQCVGSCRFGIIGNKIEKRRLKNVKNIWLARKECVTLRRFKMKGGCKSCFKILIINTYQPE